MSSSAPQAGLEVLEAGLGPSVRAGFTTRAGGVSVPPWDGLNLGLAVGDDPDRVRRNRELLAQWAGVPVAFATQVHGRDVVVVDGPPADRTDSVAVADALVTTRTDVALAVLVADCVPVLLADPETRVVAAVHAGRGGLVAGVVQAALDVMTDLGARLDRVVAAVGPSIAGRSYEVPADLRDAVAQVVPASSATTSWGTPALDLAFGVVAGLAAAGVHRVHRVDRDTFRDPGLYSHRRATAAGTTTGRSCGIVRLLPAAPRVAPPTSEDALLA
ncbi:MAG: multicopper polyphenol oxidase [Cellulomonas sp. 73-145]|uniref:peptidoglycan editing factor PgeF n=1 Tax=Cellulomonas sp. 73-145 TaxID=1895739 RepID=UPI0009297B31|nr:peptidoglycan editing factor PgeF [Cellulomonas sp. 73-145]OJV59489.1 MAG: multicopper polyphenol oxidase [Cellulomonas sp. 73-145]